MVAPIKHFRSLSALGQEARKPIFSLTPADGAMGAHSVAANAAYKDFEELSKERSYDGWQFFAVPAVKKLQRTRPPARTTATDREKVNNCRELCTFSRRIDASGVILGGLSIP